MPQPFCPGYAYEPYRQLCESFPGAAAYPDRHFRVEWGAVFHRGRLDGTARVLVIGLAPGQLEVVLRRVIVGHAGQRLQGFLAKLGIERSYVMLNTFLYSAYGHEGSAELQDQPDIVAYRNLWLDALFAGGAIDAVIALGARADGAWRAWKATPAGAVFDPAYVKIPHPTQPESSSKGNPDRYQVAMETMLREWNAALHRLKPALRRPDVDRPLIPYGKQLLPGDVVVIPQHDLPPGIPAWMAARDHWTKRAGDNPLHKRGNLTITVPREFLP